jgi:hypothetical protein
MESIGEKSVLDEAILRGRTEFEAIIRRLRRGDGKETLDQAERDLFADMLRLGQELMRVYLAAQGDGHVGPSAKAPDGQELPFHSHKSVAYRSVFGVVPIRRAYYWAPDRAGFCPLDAQLNLPERKDSYLLMEWALRMGVEESYDESCAGLFELLRLGVPKAQLEEHVTDAGSCGRTFYDEKQAPKPKDEGPILAVCADGKGVPMKKSVPAEAPKRLSKGQKRQKKRMAFVGTVYTSEARHHAEDDPRPQNKEVFAELQKRECFAQELFERARRRAKGVRRKAFLADGQRELWEIQKEYFPDYTPILDWMHASEYLWKAAYLWLPESSPQAHAWVERQQGRFRRGKVKDVIREIKRLIADETIAGAQQQKQAEKIVAYFQRNRKRMRYDLYRRRGLPIGSGAVEGACRHLVKDRMERSGMRWTIEGAQALLFLRAIRVSGHWEAFWTWYRESERQRLYGRRAA